MNVLKEFCKFVASALVLISGVFLGTVSGYVFLSLVGLV
jgi:hypothetical protein